jgi:hypothetical protein
MQIKQNNNLKRIAKDAKAQLKEAKAQTELQQQIAMQTAPGYAEKMAELEMQRQIRREEAEARVAEMNAKIAAGAKSLWSRIAKKS